MDNGRITSVIDWQGAWAAPLLLKALHSRLVDYDGEMILKPPANYKELDPEKKADLKKQMANSILLHLYELGTAKRNPRLNKVLRFELGRIRCYPMMFASDTWEDDIIPLRESLIKLKK